MDALVCLSGGQDSTTALYWAKQNFEKVHSLTILYGQRHSLEVEAANKIASLAEVETHEVLKIGAILRGTSPLINPREEVKTYASVEHLPGGIEPTFIPGRNILFLVLAANRAVAKGIDHIVIGVSAVDYGGYPDCRPEFIHNMTQALRTGLGKADFYIHTPLIYMSKAETVKLALSLPGCMEALKYSHTCYKGVYPPCGKCHACLLRAKGFREVGVEDPLLRR